MKRICTAGLILLSVAAAHTQSWISATRLSSPEDITFIRVRFDSAHNIYVFGSFTGTLSAAGIDDLVSGGGNDYFIMKINRSGIPQWMTAIGSKKDDDLTGGMDITGEGTVVIAGGFSDTLWSGAGDTLLNEGSFDIFLAAYGTDGEELWLKKAVYGEDIQKATSLCIDNEDNVILAGQFRDSTNMEDQFAMDYNDLRVHGFYSKFSSGDGSFLWGKPMESLNDQEGIRISDIFSKEGIIILAGSFRDSVGIGTDTLVSINGSEDIFVISAVSDGNLNWIRTISGTEEDQARTILMDDSDRIYVSGQYSSPYLKTDTITPDSLYTETNMGGYDLYSVCFTAGGELEWLVTTGGSGNEMAFGSEMLTDSFAFSGYFSDTLFWGDTAVFSSGPTDDDLFIGYIDTGGGFNGIRTLTGAGTSHEESKATFHTGNDTIYSLIYSNATLLQIGDEILTSPHNNYHITLGIMGCRPLSVDNVVIQDVGTCYGDSTGSLRIFAAGGFGPPYRYSIDAGNNFGTFSSLISGLPAGFYDVAIMDRENCSFIGPTVEIVEPDPIEVEIIIASDITATAPGLIGVTATGGIPPYDYTLQPGGIAQWAGTFVFVEGDSGTYLVEVSDTKDCGPAATDSITILDLTHLGIGDNNAAITRIYPNPSSGEITVEVAEETEEVIFEIVNSAGLVVIKKRVRTSGGLLKETIDISNLEKGIYIIRVRGKTLSDILVM